MAENRSKNVPSFQSIDELVEFFETHDMGEYWDQMPQTSFDVHITKAKHYIAIDGELLGRIARIAKSEQLSAEELISIWLKEKVG